jgi:alpha-L-rhamnosidase
MLRQTAFLLMLLLLFACSAKPESSLSTPANILTPAPNLLRVEGADSAINIGRYHPRLSWRSRVKSQSAYEIEVASSIEILRNGTADLWSSGQVIDGRSVAIAYGGADLSSRQIAFWRVRIWAEGETRPSPWSGIASWQMGLLNQSDWQAKWITSPMFPAAPSTPGLERWLEATAADPQFKDAEKIADTKQRLRDVRPATYFRKDFKIDRPIKSARLYSTSAGYSEVFLNGKKVGDRILNPAQTDFDKRIYYDVDDVTDVLSKGENVLGLHLGNGFYGERTAFGLRKLFYGEPAAIAQLEIEYMDGARHSVLSDDTWQARPSPIIKNGVYSGEVFDARKHIADWASQTGQNAQGWQPAAVLNDAPTALLVAAEMPPVRRVKPVKAKAILNPEDGIWTIDFGANFTGLPTIDAAQLNLTAGQTIILRYAEWADTKGRVSMKSGGGAPRTKQVDAYVSDGTDAEPWSPKFTWHGFRYMEISGLDRAPPLDAFTAHLTRTDIKPIGRFMSSDPQLNRIHDTALRTFESNMVSVLSDCPIRERNGWTGDAHAVAGMASYNFAMGPFLDKFLGDFRTTEQIAPTIVPGRRTRSGMVDWAAAEVFLTWEHYLHNGDMSVIERQYDSLLDYIAYVETITDGDLIANSNHFYGDWCDTLPEVGLARPLGRCMSYSTPGAVTATALIIRAYNQMSDMAALLGKADEAQKFGARRDAMRKAFNQAFYKDDIAGYGSQTGNAMALQFGIAPANKSGVIASAIANDVRSNWGGRSSVGALGQSWLYPALSDYGHTDTAYGIFHAKGAGSFSYLFDELGATSIWEDPTKFPPGVPPGKSLRHPFHSGYDAWFYSGLGGISPDPKRPGYKQFNLRPVFPAKLDEADVTLETGYGKIYSAWRRESEAIIWTIKVPLNTKARVKLIGISGESQMINSGRHVFHLDRDGKFLKQSEE